VTARPPLRIAIVTDAWYPQINGVVRTLDTVRRELTELGHPIEIIAPDRFRTIPAPSYPEIPLALLPGRRMKRLLDEFAPEAIHIATEGPLGWAARRYCLRRRLPFTTSFHTKFPEYIHARWRIPIRWGYAMMRRFHAPSKGVMVATPSLAATLGGYGFRNLRRWTRGVDTALFRPRPKVHFNGRRPVFLFAGRVAVEKNIETFLALDLPGTKVVIGDGPLLPALKARHPDTIFTGYKRGEELAEHIASADVFVFPSLTDTFGLVLLEALASGVPVAAFPVTGPIDVAPDAKLGCLDWDLAKAARAALDKRSEDCRAYAEGYSWSACANIFLTNLHPFASQHTRKSLIPALMSE
jgi:glycosyltransferase involved in cell wall biosynthesis